MADQRLTDKAPIDVVSADDLIHVVDVSDTSGDPAGTSKKATTSQVAVATSGTLQQVTTNGATSDVATDFTNLLNAKRLNYDDEAVSVYRGLWNASTNTPALANTDIDVKAFRYRVSVAGSVNFGAGEITFGVGDYVEFEGTQWIKNINNNQVGTAVQSVTGDSVDNTDPSNPVVNAIPLAGTEVGSPVTGDIQLLGEGSTVKFYSENTDENYRGEIVSAENYLQLLAKNLIGDNQSSFDVNPASAGFQSNDGTDISSLASSILEFILTSSNSSFKGFVGSAYYGANYDDNTYVQKKYVDDSFTEQNLKGAALYNATTTGAVNIPCSTFASWRRILTGNTTFTFTETPASGESFTRYMDINSTAAETLAFGNATHIIGTYANDTSRNKLTIELSNFPTEGLVITVFINPVV